MSDGASQADRTDTASKLGSFRAFRPVHPTWVGVESHQLQAQFPAHHQGRFLERAEAAGADFLVTGNKRHFPKQLEEDAGRQCPGPVGVDGTEPFEMTSGR